MRGARTNLPLPKAPYLPGQGVHPSRDPAREPAPLPLHGPVEGLFLADLRLHYGADLFDAGFHWECHEVLEGLWLELPNGQARDLTQGLILLAASLLKRKMGKPAPAERLLRRASQRLESGASALPEEGKSSPLARVEALLAASTNPEVPPSLTLIGL